MVQDISYLEQYNTWPKLLKYNYEQYGERRKAMRYKYLGIWQPYTWKDYYLNVKYLALGMIALGLEAGDKALIIGDNAPEYYFAQLAVQCNHGISVGLYSDFTPQEIKFVANNSQPVFIIAQDQEQLDKLMLIKNELSFLKKIIYWRYKGLSHYQDAFLIGFREVLKLGQDYDEKHPGIFEKNIESGRPDDVCSIIYTSGTTRETRGGAIHSFRTLRCGSEYFLKLDPWNEDDNFVSYLPPASIAEEWLSLGCHLLSGSISNFAEETETQLQDMREISPTMIFYNTFLWERQAGKLLAKIQGADALKRLAFRIFMPIGYKAADASFTKQKMSLYWRVLAVLGEFILFRPIRDSLGLSHARICYTSGSILTQAAIRFYHALNVPLKSFYASTEGGNITGSRNSDIRPETVGTVYKGVEIKITDQGEIISHQPGTFLGYYKDPERTAEVLKNDWFYSGDNGYLTEDGYLVFIDRLNDIITSASGEKLAPQDIESRLKFNPFIKDAWVMAGPNNDYASAVIVIDLDNISAWADKRKVAYTMLVDLSQKPEVYNLIEQEINRVNHSLSQNCRIKKFVILHKEFDPDESELTRNRKLRRSFIANRYKELVRAVYSDNDSVSVESQIRYQDGRTSNIKNSIRIKTIEGID
jgi:long-chain acyl-CoA synthetase